jgi:phospholipase/carboxylesterase
MKAEAYEGKALAYVLVTPDNFEPGAGWPMVVLLHGFGTSMYDLAGLASAIDANGYVYALPNGPYPLDFGNGPVGYSWMTGRQGVADPPADAPSLDELLDGFMEEVLAQTGAERGKCVLGGFSQGGGLTLRYGLPRPETFTGLAVLSGLFRDPEAMRQQLPLERSQRVFIAHGSRDDRIPVDAGRGAKAFLDEAGYDAVYHEYDMGHEITAAVLRDLVPWLHETLVPKT